MSLRLPVLSRMSLQSNPDAVTQQVETFVANASASGYVRGDMKNGTSFLFLLRGKTFCAGIYQQERFGALSVGGFLSTLQHCHQVELCTTDLPLFLCTAVLFRKAPAAQIPSQLMDSANLLGHVEQMGKDAVLVVRRGEAHNLIFCRGGEPVALYPATGEAFPDSSSVTDRIIEYIYADTAHPSNVMLDLYDEVRLPPAADADRSLSEYRSEPRPDPNAPETAIVVRLGDRVVFRYPVTKDVLSVGRGGGNDVALDNLSVSRRHAEVRRVGADLVVTDLGSENGILWRGKKVKSAQLAVGDEVGIGKYTLVHRQFSPGEEAPAPKRRTTDAVSVEETIAMTSHTKVGELQYAGGKFLISGALFSIGKKAEASLRIKGFFVAPIHAQVGRQRDGAYVLQHVDGRQAVKVNGEKIQRAQLRDGDEITIGSERLVFHLVRYK